MSGDLRPGSPHSESITFVVILNALPPRSTNITVATRQVLGHHNLKCLLWTIPDSGKRALQRAHRAIGAEAQTEEEDAVEEADQEVNEKSGGQAASSQMVPQPAEEDREMRLSSRSERYHLRPNPAPSQRLQDCAY
ncbi:hypothetical protein NDU88_003404 [Pleurodeles waltl]|uniref:Uncharacterized protein n=1 Tax=Pleurodeles waltl TaxID=8319 RepID=A0AAV7UG38_PLEWA|nr:hypothetical protein NDU88_003404 [Pleurodeles waltl]